MRRWLAVVVVVVVALWSSPLTAAQSRSAHDDPGRQILVLLRQMPTHDRGGAYAGGSYGDLATRAARERLGRRIARENRLEFVGNWPMPVIDMDCFIMAVPDGETVETAAQRVSRHTDVEWSQPVNRYRTFGDVQSYNDPLFTVAPATRQWNLLELHGQATGNRVSVAVIDTRVDSTHPDLNGQVSANVDFVINQPGGPETHGTAVAGIIAARANNGVGGAGVAPKARLMALRACQQLPDDRGSVCDSLSLAKALHYAIEQRADVINLSLGGPEDRLLGRLINAGLSRGAIIVAATDARFPGGGFPASHPGVIAVSNIPFTNAPPGVVTAPGQDVPTTLPGGRWHLVNGSSYAAAHVSGLMALLREGRTGPRAAASPVVIPNSGGLIDARSTLRQATRP